MNSTLSFRMPDCSSDSSGTAPVPSRIASISPVPAGEPPESGCQLMKPVTRYAPRAASVPSSCRCTNVPPPAASLSPGSACPDPVSVIVSPVAASVETSLPPAITKLPWNCGRSQRTNPLLDPDSPELPVAAKAVPSRITTASSESVTFLISLIAPSLLILPSGMKPRPAFRGGGRARDLTRGCLETPIPPSTARPPLSKSPRMTRLRRDYDAAAADGLGREVVVPVADHRVAGNAVEGAHHGELQRAHFRAAFDHRHAERDSPEHRAVSEIHGGHSTERRGGR